MNTPVATQLDRRLFLGASFGFAATAFGLTSCGVEKSGAAGAATVLPEGLLADDFIMHGTNPWTLETKRARLGGGITPSGRVFVRGNLPFPDPSILDDRDAWQLEIAGVASPKTMTLAELKALGSKTITAVLQCSGNGRKFFEHGPSGSPWGVGAAANVQWTGVPLAKVMEALGGAAEGMRFVTGTGGEPLPEMLNERDVIVERSIPYEKALRDAILAWDLNGEPISLAHGGPLRLVVPGYYGVNNIKYLKRLAATADETDAKIQAKSYRVRPLGISGAPDQPSMYDMNVKSWITGPIEDAPSDAPLKAGLQTVRCVAFCGTSEVASVEISTDGGATWTAAEAQGEAMGPYAWREFSIKWNATAGKHMLASRATDAEGNVQPKLRLENERGYAHNGWFDPSVRVEIV
ncbi:MAG: DMSO/TMAO reductase YedYZ molybdopterin-dependent catalytic subunit [Planctomycetota bacterium]|jgi:DMSO/TMAO reductase YedYZ molybdopterin-dependent catalytic subunit